MFWNKTITLYNKHTDSQTGIVQWYRHSLKNCFCKVTKKKKKLGNVQQSTDDNIVRIPAQTNYLPPHMWDELPKDKMSTYITLQGGDLIFLGDISDEIDEYTSGKRSSDLIAKYEAFGCVFVNSVSVNDFMMGEHYLIRGE